MAGLLDTILGSDDPSTADPNTGLLESQRRQLAFSALGNIGATLLAAGENLMPQDRARILAGLGDVPNQMAQQQLMMQRSAQARRQEMADAELSKLGRSPEFMQAVSQMPPEMQAAIPALFRAGRAREAIAMAGDWRQAQAREAAAAGRQGQAPAGYQWTSNGQLAPIPGGPADPAQAGALAAVRQQPKEIPGKVVEGMNENLAGIRKIDAALTELARVPDSVGGPGSIAASIIPGVGNIQNRIDTQGTALRALIADIGSLKIHDRSGAAVTAAEFPRLKPFIPTISDDPETVKTKLLNFRKEYEAVLRDTASHYSTGNYRPYEPAQEYATGSAPPPPEAPAADAPPASALKDGHVTNFANGQSWTLQGGKPVRVK